MKRFKAAFIKSAPVICATIVGFGVMAWITLDPIMDIIAATGIAVIFSSISD